MRKILFVCLFLSARFAYSSMIYVPYISQVTSVSYRDCNQISPAALCYQVKWDSYPTDIDDNAMAVNGYKYNIFVLQNHYGRATFYGWDTNSMPQSVPLDGTVKRTWQSVIKNWIRVNGASGTGFIHLNSGNQDKGIGCFQFGGIKEGWFSTDYVTLPGTYCRIIPPPKNQCKITTNSNNEFDFGVMQGGTLDGVSLTIPFSLTCTLPTNVTAYLANASNKIYLKNNESSSQLYATMSLDNVDFKADGTRSFKTDNITSDHTLKATLHKTSEKIGGGEYSGSSALIIAID